MAGNWNNRIDEHLVQVGYRKCPSEANLYRKGDDINFIGISVYSNHLLVTRSNDELAKKFKEDMQ